MASTVLNQLRDLIPGRPLSVSDSRWFAELQATKFLKMAEIPGPPVPQGVITSLPRIEVIRRASLRASGLTCWTKSKWLITLNSSESWLRQRFSLCHEIKHVVDDPFITFLYPALPYTSSYKRGEQACNYFAASLLMPRPWLKQAVSDGINQVNDLAQLFEVSPTAMRVRLQEIGLAERKYRCGRPRVYERALPVGVMS